jgi:hypothetical protein
MEQVKMKNKYRLFLIITCFSLPYNTYADNYGPGPYIFALRTIAFIYPDLSRSICKDESNDVKDKLENAIESSGLLIINESDLCDENLCRGKTVKEAGLDRTVQSIRKQQFDMYRRKSKKELEVACKKAIAILERINGKGKSPNEILDIFVNGKS